MVRIAICQYCPMFCNPLSTMSKVTSMLQNCQDISKKKVDVILLPEMAFTGYMFKNEKHVEPFTEVSGQGNTFQWCSETALKYNCFVVAGYPEKELIKNINGRNEIKLYNSLYFVNPQGKLVTNYRKTFLYDTDKTWALEGASFKAIDVPELGGKVGIGICMDINPKNFEAPWNAYEFANFQRDQKSKLILFSCAWLDSDQEEEDGFKTQQYWAARLSPLQHTNTVFCCSNRTGTESGTKFCGSSCAIKFSSPQAQILVSCDKSSECVQIVDVKI